MAAIHPKVTVNIFWFRRDLRLHDNHGLYQALKSIIPVLPVFIFDTHILDALKDKRDKRVAFIHDTLLNLQKQLNAFGSSLYALHGKPKEVFKRLAEEFNIKAVYTNQDYEPYAIKRDQNIETFLSKKQIPLHAYKDQVIFEKDEVVKKDGTPYTVFTPYANAWKAKYVIEKKPRYLSENHAGNFLKTKPLQIPSLHNIGFEKAEYDIQPGELDKSLVKHYDETRNIPSIAGTSRMSVHLRFGTVSIRELAAKASQWNETFLNELIWREFFMMILFHFPQVVTESFKSKYDLIEWRNNENEFQLWCKGETGYPLVDAGMRELNQTGFMHNRIRMVVASFLTKHLLIDWRWGEAYFAEKLMDYELSSNNGNWQWAAGCGCDAAPYFRIFNPSEQQKKFDPDLTYIKKWIKDFQSGYLPTMVDHEFARKRALAAYQKGIMDRL